MRSIMLASTAVAAAALAGCATYDTVAPAPRTVAAVNASAVCGNTTYVDSNNDGWISGDEWNMYRTSTYSYWDTDHDGRISQAEFQNCWAGNGFYRDAYYNRDYWNPYWTGFDVNRDGYLSADEYWSTQAFATLDVNHNGRIDVNEAPWPTVVR
ncbi:MAG TPA: EF-hand domain-containing protein [Sphingomicrobium sp.]|jgi:hypothetical protein|nr:EF-hand domain-containing protein [Sphingomicrobium sp.]